MICFNAECDLSNENFITWKYSIIITKTKSNSNKNMQQSSLCVKYQTSRTEMRDNVTSAWPVFFPFTKTSSNQM